MPPPPPGLGLSAPKPPPGFTGIPLNSNVVEDPPPAVNLYVAAFSIRDLFLICLPFKGIKVFVLKAFDPFDHPQASQGVQQWLPSARGLPPEEPGADPVH